MSKFVFFVHLAEWKLSKVQSLPTLCALLPTLKMMNHSSEATVKVIVKQRRSGTKEFQWKLVLCFPLMNIKVDLMEITSSGNLYIFSISEAEGVYDIENSVSGERSAYFRACTINLRWYFSQICFSGIFNNSNSIFI